MNTITEKQWSAFLKSGAHSYDMCGDEMIYTDRAGYIHYIKPNGREVR